MLLSHAHRFVFVRGRKVAGTSVEIALSTICGPDDIVPALIPVDERLRQTLGGRSGNYSDDPLRERAYAELVRTASADALSRLAPPPSHYPPHMALREIATRHDVGGYRTISVVRDPYARVLSALNMRQFPPGAAAHGPLAGDPALFRDAFDRQKKDVDRLRIIDLYRGADGRLPATILRYETLENDFAKLLAELGIAQPIALPHAKMGLLSNDLDPLSLLRRDQIDAIGAIFADEFEAFGYRRL